MEQESKIGATGGERERFPLFVVLRLIVLYVVLHLFTLGMPVIGGSSEAREAQVIDIIRRDGTWVLPLRNGVIPSKPPLYHWTGAILSWIAGGVTELTVRLPSLLFSGALLFLTGLVAFRLATSCRSRGCARQGPACAALSVGILSLTYGFHHMSTQAMVDMTSAFFMWISLTALVFSDSALWRFEGRLSRTSVVLFWLAISGAILARGPAGIVVPFVIVGAAAWYVLGWKVALRSSLQLCSWGAVVLIAPLAWYCGAWLLGGDAFVQRQLVFENMRRFVGGDNVNSEAWWFYIPSLARTTFPWGLVLLALLFTRGRPTQSVSAYRGEPNKLFVAPLVSLIAGVLFFSAASGKRHSYMLPLYPLIAIQLSLFITDLWESAAPSVMKRLSLLAARSRPLSAFLALISVGVIGFLASPETGLFSLPPVVAATISACALPLGIVILFAATPALFVPSARIGANITASWLALTGILVGISALGTSIKANLKGFPEIAGAIRDEVGDEESLAVIKEPFDEYFDPVLYYLHRPVRLIQGQTPLECRTDTLYVTKIGRLQELQSTLNGSVTIVRTLREVVNGGRERDDREIALFRCGASPDRAWPKRETTPIRYNPPDLVTGGVI